MERADHKNFGGYNICNRRRPAWNVVEVLQKTSPIWWAPIFSPQVWDFKTLILSAHAAYIVKETEPGYSSLVLIFLLVIEVRLFNKDIIFLWWGRGYNKSPLVFQPMECWIIVVCTIGCMVTLKEVHAFYWINNNVLGSYDMYNT